MQPTSVIFILLATSCICNVNGQQCRYVIEPDCDDERESHSNGLFGRTSKGEKGDRGFSGKFGPKGSKGDSGLKGDLGQKGVQGETASVEELTRRVDELQSNLTQAVQTIQALNNSISRVEASSRLLQPPIIGGWTVFQKRFDGSVDFHRNWTDYKNGFGSTAGEFWIGLEAIHRATNGKTCRLRVDLIGFDNARAYAKYRNFSIDSETNLYRLYVGSYQGTAGDCLTKSSYNLNNIPFSTIDRDNDVNGGNCALTGHDGGIGAWWNKNCAYCYLNAVWGRSTGQYRNIIWHPWKGWNEALKATEMKYRCD